MDPIPSCSNYSTSNQQCELDVLKDIGVNVWGQEQEILEQQALDELRVFNENISINKQTINETDESNDKTISQTLGQSNETTIKLVKIEKHSNFASQTLDINSYIKRQEDLKKRQVYKKSLGITDKSKDIANQINQKQTKSKSTKNHKSQVERNKLKRKRDNSKEIILENGNREIVNEDNLGSDIDYIPSDGEAEIDNDSDYEPEVNLNSNSKRKTKKLKTIPTSNHSNNNLTSNETIGIKYAKVVDDGDMKSYEARLNTYYAKLEAENTAAMETGADLPETEVRINPNLKSSSKIWQALYGYQRDGVEWLWEVHQKVTGGLLGDEMGLGKTVQIIAFLYTLNYSRIISSHGGFKGLGPTLIVCPSTVIHQWVKHFHDWAPEFRACVLHQSGTFVGNKHKLIKDVIKTSGILITTYQSTLKYKWVLTEQNWHYVILDEGHKIRNPSAKISETVKLFKTPYRLLLTGSPMQNNLQELWSLFDFIKPGMLGSLQAFMEHFAMPIMHGGYTNATPMQEALALSMATALKSMITPHLLRRAKIDVKDDIRLPGKSEQVLFCSITPEQRDLYRGYLLSDHVSNILGRGSKNWFSEGYTRGNVLMSITTLRKICNHPEIYLGDVDSDKEGDNGNYGHYKRSGKMIVVDALLKMWKRQGHRVLLFTQSRAMIAIFEHYLTLNNYTYLKMDGGTSIGSRQPLIEKFNNDISFDVFLLTTRVGGLGVNLTGADRVIIYDPDWNPATDTQARERAWRIGQEKEVTIYRLLSAGTIEEKMYQRQIWKQLLSNKVLLDPTTQKFFRSSDLHDLFSLQEYVDTPETTNIFQNSRISIEEKLAKKKKSKKSQPEIQFTEDKIEKMKQLAAQISKNIAKPQQPETTLDDFQKERREKLASRQQLKLLTPTELLQYNRERSTTAAEDVNQLDDCETDVNFTKALVISEKAADLYKSAKGNVKHVDRAAQDYQSLTQVFSKNKEKVRTPQKTKEKLKKEKVDLSGKIEGEKIEGLVKRQSKSKKAPENVMNEQDEYVLCKLFSKKGVQSALQHDNVVHCSPSNVSSIKMHSETQLRTDNALQALRKSRIASWKW